MIAGRGTLLVVGALLLSAAPAAAQTARAPETIRYVVQRGDTLSDLGARYMVSAGSYREVQRLNKVSDPRRMPVGRPLDIPVKLLKTVPDAATVAGFRGAASLVQDGRSSTPVVGQTLREGVVVTTGPNAFLRVALSDGSYIVVPSNSRMRLDRVRRVVLNGAVDHAMSVQAGRSEMQVAPRKAPGGFIVRTPLSVSAVRGTDFRVSHDDAAGRSVTEVVEGSVHVNAEGRPEEMAVGEAQGLMTGKDGVRLVQMLPAPRLRNPDRPQMEPEVVFDVVPLEGAARYRGRLATDAGMVDALSEAVSEPGGTQLAFGDLPEGLYFLRSTAVSPEGVEGLSTVYSVLRARNGLNGLSAGKVGNAKDRSYRFRWETDGDGEAVFRFQLWSEGKSPATPLIDEGDLTKTEIALTGLPAGAYEWRVQATRQRFGRTLEVWSKPHQLNIGR